MYAASTNAADVLFLLCAPALLAIHAIWPRRFSWVAVAIGAATLSWGLLVLGEYLSNREMQDCVPRSFTQGNTAWVEGCPLVDGFSTYNQQLGWLKGLIYLGLWLPIYGAFLLLRARIRNGRWSLPNKSLERTRGR
jgi:hypothetical protein